MILLSFHTCQQTPQPSWCPRIDTLASGPNVHAPNVLMVSRMRSPEPLIVVLGCVKGRRSVPSSVTLNNSESSSGEMVFCSMSVKTKRRQKKLLQMMTCPVSRGTVPACSLLLTVKHCVPVCQKDNADPTRSQDLCSIFEASETSRNRLAAVARVNFWHSFSQSSEKKGRKMQITKRHNDSPGPPSFRWLS